METDTAVIDLMPIVRQNWKFGHAEMAQAVSARLHEVHHIYPEHAARLRVFLGKIEAHCNRGK